MNRLKYALFIVFLIVSSFNLYASSIEIIVKLHNEIITNIDIENEKKYLIFLNPKLKQLENKTINKIAKDSLIKEIIKKKEIRKFYDMEVNNDFVESIEKNFFKNNNVKDKTEFIQFLESQKLDYKIIKEKIKIESYWNQLVYSKFNNNIKINDEDLKQNVLKQNDQKKTKIEFNISEILFSDTLDRDLNKTFDKINSSIKNIGFENSANLYSISSSSKNGGLIGWINELQISEKIRKKITLLKINETTKPIKIKGGYLILKLNDKREINEVVDVEKQIEELINKERNRQLNAFSNIYYKKLKKNILINEF